MKLNADLTTFLLPNLKTFARKNFFAIVKRNSANDNDCSPKTESVAMKKLLQAGCSQTEIVDTLFQFSPIISDKNDIKKILNSVAAQLNKPKVATSHFSGR